MKRLALVCIAVFSVSSMGCETPNLDAILDDQLPQDVVPPEGEDVGEDEEDDVDPLEDDEERSTDEDENEGRPLSLKTRQIASVTTTKTKTARGRMAEKTNQNLMRPIGGMKIERMMEMSRTLKWRKTLKMSDRKYAAIQS